MRFGEECLQPAGQHHDQTVHERGDADIDGNQQRQFVCRGRRPIDKFGQYGNKEQRRLLIQKIGDKTPTEMNEVR